MTLKYSACLLLTASTYLALNSPTAYAGCLPKAVVEKYGLYHGCPEGNTIKVFRGGKYGYITPQGQVITDFIYDDAGDFEEGIASVAIWDTENRDYLWGAIDEAGNEVIALQYENPLNFSEGLALVKKDNAVRYIDYNGKTRIDPKFFRASSFKNGRAIVDYSHFNEVINAKGEVILPSSPTALSRLNENLFIRYTWDQQYIIDLNMNIYQKGVYVTPIDNNTQTADNGYRNVQEDNSLWYMLTVNQPSYAKTYHLMNNDGDIVFKNLIMPDKGESAVSTVNGMTVIDTGSHLQVIDGQGNIRLSGDFDSIFPFIENNLAIVKKEDKSYYYQLQPINQKSIGKSDLMPYNDKSTTVGQLVIDQSFDKLGLFSKGLAFAKQGAWRGFIDKSGHKIKETPYDWVTPFVNGFAIFSNSSKWGVMDEQGKTVLAPKYNQIRNCGSYFIVEEDGISGVFNSQGKEVVEMLYTEIDCYDDFVITSDRRDIRDYGTKLLYLEDGQFYPYKLDSLLPMKDGYAAVTVYKPDEQGVIQPFTSIVDKTGNITLIKQRNHYLHNIGEGLFTYNDRQKGKVLLNSQGTIISEGKYDYFDNAVDGYIPAEKNNRWGVIDTAGNEILPPIYKELTILGDDLFMVEKSMGVINKQGEDLIPPMYDDISFLSDGFVKLTINSIVSKSEGILSPELKSVLPVEYSEIEYLEDDVFAFNKGDNLWGIANTKEDILTTEQYQKVERNTDNRLSIMEKGKWGLLADNGNQIVASIYEEIDDEKEGLIAVKYNGKYGYIDIDGKLVIDYKFDEAKQFAQDEAYVEMDDKAYYIDNQGKILRETSAMRSAAAEAKPLSR